MTSRNIIIGMLLALVIWLLYQWQCTKKVEPLNIETNEVQQPRIDSINEKHKREIDSVYLLKADAEKEAELWADYAKEVEGKYSKLEKQLSKKIEAAPCPEDFKEDLTKDFSHLQAENKNKDLACTKQLAAKDKNISQLTAAMKLSQSKNSAISKELAKCMESKGKALDVATNKQKNKLAVGVVSNIYPVLGIGAGADFIHKSGWVFSASGTTMYKDIHVQIGVKKVISLRK